MISIKQLLSHLKSDFDRPVVMPTSVDAKPAPEIRTVPPSQQPTAGGSGR